MFYSYEDPFTYDSGYTDEDRLYEAGYVHISQIPCINSVRNLLQNIIDMSYGKKDFDRYEYDRCLEDLCFHIDVEYPASDLSMDKMERLA